MMVRHNWHGKQSGIFFIVILIAVIFLAVRVPAEEAEGGRITPALPDAETWLKLQVNKNGIGTTADLKEYLPDAEGVFFIKNRSSVGTLDENGVYTALKRGTDTAYAIRDGQILKIFHISIYRWGAHRGYRTQEGEALYFENTEKAYIQAALAGADSVEVDVRRTKDGVLVCFHGADARKKTNSTVKSIENMSFDMVRNLVYTYGAGEEDPEDPDNRVCTFERCMEICRAYNIYLTIDLKSAPTEEQTALTIETLADYLLEKQESEGIEAYDFIGFINEKNCKNTPALKACLLEKGVKVLPVPGHANYNESPLLQELGDEPEPLDQYQVLAGTDLGYPSMEYTGAKRVQGSALTVYGIRHTAETDELIPLLSGTDYKAVYSDNTEIGTANIRITGKEGWQGALDASFEITPVNLSEATITVNETPVYDGERKTPEITVTKMISGKMFTFERDTDFTVRYKNNRKAGTNAKVCISGTGQTCIGSGEKAFTILAEIDSVELDRDAIEYTGRARRIAKYCVVRADVNGKSRILTKDIDYGITYEDNVDVGRATMIITGKGAYTGTLKTKFAIVPRKTSIVSAEAGKTKATLKWKERIEETDGFQIQYSKNADFSSKVKTVTVKNCESTSKTLRGLKRKTAYYFRIRSYCRTEGKTFYSEWSRAKKVKTA